MSVLRLGVVILGLPYQLPTDISNGNRRFPDAQIMDHLGRARQFKDAIISKLHGELISTDFDKRLVTLEGEQFARTPFWQPNEGKLMESVKLVIQTVKQQNIDN